LKRAFISVWDKTGLKGLAKYLLAQGFDLVSTGGTAQEIESWAMPVTRVEEITGQPALMDGRIKTTDLRIFGPILADLDKPKHVLDLEQLGQEPMQLVVVNLYPFEEMEQKGLSHEELLEYIDIGGPSLLRAAAKNHKHLLVLHRPEQYATFEQLYDEFGDDIPLPYRKAFAVEVFQHTAAYDELIGAYFSDTEETLPATIKIKAARAQELRYGENPHQQAAFYLPRGVEPPWQQLHGKELSFNNYADLETASRIVSEFDQPAAVIVKHANPCGFAVGADLAQAYRLALTTDPVSSFGGIVGLNRTVDEQTAQVMAEIFLECIIAPGFSSEAQTRLTRKKNLRLLESASHPDCASSRNLRMVAGGYLVQESDNPQGEERWETVSERKPTPDEMHAMRLGWKLVRFVKSNAIVLANDEQLLGVGAGQMSRVDAVILAGMKAAKAQLDLSGGVMASDAFFPFPDGVEEAASLGITAVIQPGGSIRDEAVIEAADTHQIAMIFTRTRHFRH
jgi:phosphoribosylaminoimidazolecarboxamide formyltransferase/IMP cyclohydrolase